MAAEARQSIQLGSSAGLAAAVLLTWKLGSIALHAPLPLCLSSKLCFNFRDSPTAYTNQNTVSMQHSFR